MRTHGETTMKLSVKGLKSQCIAGAMVLVGCVAAGYSQSAKSMPRSQEKSAAPTTTVYVMLEGAWILTADPSVPGGFLGIAPNMKDHIPLYVQARQGITLGGGEYWLAINNIPNTPSSPPTPNSYRAYAPKVASSAVPGVVADHSGKRYVFHFPPPNAIGEETSGESRITDSLGTQTIERAMDVSLQYQISTDNTPQSLPLITAKSYADPPSTAYPAPPADTTPTLPYSIALGNPALIRIGSMPNQPDYNPCSPQSQETFASLMSLLGTSAQIGYPPYSAGCSNCQGPNGGSAMCSANPFVDDLEVVKNFLDSSAQPNIDSAEAILSGKGLGGQKELIGYLTTIQHQVDSVHTDNIHTPQEKLDAQNRVRSILKAMSIPHADCKTPLVAPAGAGS
jgi:hypothetical protein